MSSRWPQTQQDERSAYAPYDEAWRADDGSAGWPDAGFQDAGWQQPDDQGGWPAQDGWSAAPGRAQPAGRTAQAVAEAWAPPKRERPSAARGNDFEQDWSQSAGGFGDDADYEWIGYLTGGRSTRQPKPDTASAPPRDGSGRDAGGRDAGGRDAGGREARQRDRDRGATRRGGRSERLRSRRGHDHPESADAGRRAAPDDAGRQTAPPDGGGRRA